MRENRIHENNFFIGMDIGGSSSVVSYYDYISKKPHIYDMTGGYGEASIPMVLQYIKSEKKWLIGADARNNIEQEETYYIENLFGLLLSKEQVKIDDKVYTPSDLLIIYIKIILDSLKLVNPLVHVKALTIAIADDLFFLIEEDLVIALEQLEPIDVSLIPSTKGMIEYLVHNDFLAEGTNYINDYGYFAFRKYRVKKDNQDIRITLDLIDEIIGGQEIEAAILALIEARYLEAVKEEVLSDMERAKIKLVFYQYYARVFREHAKKKGLKIYYNFVHPPFYKVLSFEEIDARISPFVKKLEGHIQEGQDHHLLLTGNGYKMIWPKEKIKKISQVESHKVYDLVSKGSCLLAAKAVTKTTAINLEIETCRASHYGVYISQGDQVVFEPIVEGRALMNVGSVSADYIVDLEASGDKIFSLYTKKGKDQYQVIKSFTLDEEKAVNHLVRIRLSIKALDKNEVEVDINYLPI